MKTHFRILAAGLAFLPAIAMAAPNFSGTWLRDRAKSDPAPYPFYWLARPGPTPPAGNGPDITIDVQQSAQGMKVTSLARPQRNYVFDGRPHQTVTDTLIARADVTATMRDDALTVVIAQPVGGMPGNVGATITETWRLSPDGKVLTISSVRAAPARSITVNEVYNRQ